MPCTAQRSQLNNIRQFTKIAIPFYSNYGIIRNDEENGIKKKNENENYRTEHKTNTTNINPKLTSNNKEQIE